MTNQTNVTYLGTKNGVWVNEGEQKNLSVFKMQALKQADKPQVAHIVLLVDVSYSMSGSMDKLRSMVKSWPRNLNDNTYVSVIIYSGHGDSKLVISAVRSDSVSLQMAKYDEIVDKEVHPISNTVMSEPLEITLRIVKDAASVCDFHGVVLMTDGCLVPSLWDRKEEAEKCFVVADACREAGVALNAVGFGHYYDRKFLKSLIDRAATGTLSHAESMTELSDQIDYISFGLSGAIRVDIDTFLPEGVRAVVPSQGIITSGSLKVSSLPQEGYEILGFLHDGDVSGVVFNDLENTVVLDVENKSSQQLDNTSSFDMVSLALASVYAKDGDIDEAEFIIRQLGDVSLADSLSSSYSFKESGEAAERIREAIYDESLRFAGGRHPAEAPKPEGICIVDLVQRLLQEDGNKLLWDTSTPYNAIGRRTNNIDDNVKFVREKDVIVPVTSAVVAASKLNVGIKVRIPGLAVDKVSGTSLACDIIRDRNIVLNGNLNVPFLTAELNKETYDLLISEGVDMQLRDTTSYEGVVYDISLDGLKMVNKSYAKSMTSNEIAEALYKVEELKDKQYVWNKKLQDLAQSFGGNYQPDELSIVEQELRNLLHINSDGLYEPEKVEKDKTSAVEVYPQMVVEWGVAKFPSKQKRESFSTELESKLGSVKDPRQAYADLNVELKELRKQIRNLEMKISMVRIAAALSRKSPLPWDTEETKSKKKTSSITGNNLVVGGESVKRTASVGSISVVQNQWLELVEV